MKKIFLWLIAGFIILPTAYAVSEDSYFIEAVRSADIYKCMLKFKDSLGVEKELFLDDQNRIIKDPTKNLAYFIVPAIYPFKKLTPVEALPGQYYEKGKLKTEDILYKKFNELHILIKRKNSYDLECFVKKFDNTFYLMSQDNIGLTLSNVIILSGINAGHIADIKENIKNINFVKQFTKGADGTVLLRLDSFFAYGALGYFFAKKNTSINDILPAYYAKETVKGNLIKVKKKKAFIVSSSMPVNVFGIKLKIGKNHISKEKYSVLLKRLKNKAKANNSLEKYLIKFESMEKFPTGDSIKLNFKQLFVKVSLDSNLQGNKNALDRFSQASFSLVNRKFKFNRKDNNWVLQGPLDEAFKPNEFKKKISFYQVSPQNSTFQNDIHQYTATQRDLRKYRIEVNLFMQRLKGSPQHVTLPANCKLTINGKAYPYQISGDKIIINSMELPVDEKELLLKKMQISGNSQYSLKFKTMRENNNTIVAEYYRIDHKDKVLIVHYPLDLSTSYRTLFSDSQKQYLFGLDSAFRDLLSKMQKSKKYNKIYVRFGAGGIDDPGGKFIEFTGMTSIVPYLFKTPDMLESLDDNFVWSDRYLQNDYNDLTQNTTSFYDFIVLSRYSSGSSLSRALRTLIDCKVFMINIAQRDIRVRGKKNNIFIKSQLIDQLQSPANFSSIFDFNQISSFFK